MSESRPNPYHPLVRSVARGLRRRGRVSEGERLVLAVSGGADSVALMRAVAMLAPRRRWRLRLHVAHVQHHLRGEAAEADAGFVAELADRLSLPFERCDVHVAGGTEAEARRRRYAALAELAQRLDAAVVTAHQADDQLETLLMRMIRGTSIRGLRGIAWRRRLRVPGGEGATQADGERTGPAASVTLLRPMLGVRRGQVVAFLCELDQPWREDETNRDRSRWRARLRHEVLPVLRDLRPDAARQAVALAGRARELHRLVRDLTAQARSTVQSRAGAAAWGRAAARAMPRPVLHELLRSLLRERGVPADTLSESALRPTVRAIRDGRGGRRVFQFAANVIVTVTADRVTVEPGDADA